MSKDNNDVTNDKEKGQRYIVTCEPDDYALSVSVVKSHMSGKITSGVTMRDGCVWLVRSNRTGTIIITQGERVAPAAPSHPF